MKKSIKLFSLILVILTFVFFAAASGSSNSDTTTKTQAAETVENPVDDEETEPEKAETEEKTTKKASNPNQIGDYEVVIKSAKVTKDYHGDPAVIITYEFTNNSDETKAWYTAISDKAFQNGVELDTAFISTSNKDYNSSNSTKEIKPDATITVQQAFKLDDTSSNVEIEVSQWLSWNDDEVITKTFSLK